MTTNITRNDESSSSPCDGLTSLTQVPIVNVPTCSPCRDGIPINLTLSADNISTGLKQLKQLKPLKLSLTKKLDVEAIAQIRSTLMADLTLASFPYERDRGSLVLAKGWEIDKTELLRKKVMASSQQDIGDNGILTCNGLTAYIFDNKANKEIRLVFGGTNSGAGIGGERATTMRQWLANIENALSGVPKSYQEADCIATQVYEQLPEGYSLSFSGHSKGGGESSYAAMMLGAKENIPFKSINFSSAELGMQLKRNIAITLLANGYSEISHLQDRIVALSDNIVHLKVKGDPIPAMHSKVRIGLPFSHKKLEFSLLPELSHLGKTLTVPNDHTSKLHMSEHANVFSRIMSWHLTGNMQHHSALNKIRV